VGAFYINFCLENIEYDGEFYSGKFSSPDAGVYCEVLYDRVTKKFVEIWDNSKLVEDILPIAIYWLDWKLEKMDIYVKRKVRLATKK